MSKLTTALVYIAVVMVFVTVRFGWLQRVAQEGPLQLHPPPDIHCGYIVLLTFTLAESICLAYTASYYKADGVTIAVGITAAVCLGLTLFAFQTKWDFTTRRGILFVSLLILILSGSIAIFFHNKILHLVLASMGALIFSVYLVYDIQLMLGGQHKYSLSPEKYVFAAVNLYVINLFTCILSILEGRLFNYVYFVSIFLFIWFMIKW
uniref:Protein lifeguard 1-like n=1 Tax=Diabrotica virgifera virgifera TaxID=50390 RepID=A0A6P7GYH5_DIAVI